MHTLKKLLIFSLSTIISATVLLSGCASTDSSIETSADTSTSQEQAPVVEESEQSAVPSDNTDGKIELRYLLWGNQEEIEFKQKWTDVFNEQNDRIHVNLEAIPEGFHEKLTVQISSGTLADMVQIAGDFGGEYFKEDYFEPLDSYIAADSLDGSWADAVMGGLMFNGRVYAIPLTFNSGFIFYNKTMFEENNVPLPTNDWTEEDFIAAAQALTQGEGQDKIWGVDFTSWWTYSLARNLYDGYKAWDWETGTMTADTEGYRDGVQFITDLYQKYQVSPTPTEGSDIGGSFQTGKYAMTVGAAWDMKGFNEAIGDNFEWDIVTFPTNEKYGKWRSPLWTTAIGISADTPHKDECWEYIKFMALSDEVQAEIETVGLPALKATCEDPNFISTIPEGYKPFNKQVYIDALDYSVDGVVLNEIQDGIMKPELELLFAGEQDIDTTLENIQKNGQLKLDRMKDE